MLSLSPSNVGPANRQLLLAGGDLGASSTGAAQSSYARKLLSELAARLELDCPVTQWSKRGQGKPSHPNLPVDWYANISHKNGRVLVGLADGRFGLDLECSAKRHGRRLDALIDTLPEPEVRQWIRTQNDPQAAFYLAWTLYESLFKLAGHTANPASGIFAQRLQSLVQSGEAAVWQGGGWTLAVVSEAPFEPAPDPRLLFPELQPAPLTFP